MFADPIKIIRVAGLSNSSGGGSVEELRPCVLVIAGGKDVLMKPIVIGELVGILWEAVRPVFGSVGAMVTLEKASGMELSSGSLRGVGIS